MYDMIIIGAGTAGLTAGIYAARAGRDVLVLEEKLYGGQIVNTPEIENYPALPHISGYEFATNLYSQATDLGVKVEYCKATGIVDHKDHKEVQTVDHSYKTRTVILATGARNRLLGLPDEERLTGSGISYCATCDGAFFRGKIVAVVGGGNTALDDALFLSNYCEKVYLIHRRDTFRGEIGKKMALESRQNVEFILNSQVIALHGTDRLHALTVSDISGIEREIEVEGLFVAIGQVPENHAFANLIQLDANGYVRAGEDCKTNIPGIFTAGDCRTKKIKQLTTAVADGAVAALSACEYMDQEREDVFSI